MVGRFVITQVFPYGSVELTHPKRGRFKVNGKRVKPYLGGQFEKHKFEANISNARSYEICCHKFSLVEHPLGGHNLVDLTTLNKVLLGRQPKHLNHFVH